MSRRRGPHSVEALIDILRDPGRGHAAHDEAVRQLGRLRERAVEPLIALLHDGDTGVRGRAAAALGRVGGPAIKALRGRLDDADPNVRASAVLALGLTRHHWAVRPLVTARGDPEADVRRRRWVGWAMTTRSRR